MLLMENTDLKKDLYKVAGLYGVGYVGNKFKRLLPASLLLLNHQNPQVHPIDFLYRNITLKHNKEFILCVNSDSTYPPKQKGALDYVMHEPCAEPNLGTIHSHPTHIDDYVCEPSDIDIKSFKATNDKFMGIACYDNKTDRVYVNVYSR